MPTLRPSVAAAVAAARRARPGRVHRHRLTTPPQPSTDPVRTDRASSRRCAPRTGRCACPRARRRSRPDPRTTRRWWRSRAPAPAAWCSPRRATARCASGREQLVRLVEEGYLVATFSWSGGRRALVHRRGRRAARGRRARRSRSWARRRAACTPPPSPTSSTRSPSSRSARRRSTTGHDARSTSTSYTGPLLVVASTDDRSVPALSSKLVSRADDPATFVELERQRARRRSCSTASTAPQVEQADRRRARLGLRRLDARRRATRGGGHAVGRARRSDEAAPRERREADARRRTGRSPG